MNTVNVKRAELLSKLNSNRKNHRDLFLKAQEGYRKQVIEELDRMIAEAKAGKAIRRLVDLPEPQDHTKDYDTVIAMLEMSVDKTVEIQSHEFDMFVMDNWPALPAPSATNSMYVQ